MGPRVFPIYADFGAGELSPRAYGRIDLPWYHRGARRLENFIVYPQGGVTFWPGLQYVADVEDHTKKGALIPWEEPGVANYFIEAAIGKLKFYRADTMALVHTIAAGVPWSEAELPNVIFDFDGAHTMVFTHVSWNPTRLRHTAPGDTDWTLDQPSITITNYTDASLFNAAGHYPGACAFLVGRLLLAGPDSAPNVIYFSKGWDQATGTDRYLDFALVTPVPTPIPDDNAFSIPVSANKANRVYWLMAQGAALVAGTMAGEALITGGDNGITAANHFIRIVTHYGSAGRKSLGSNDAAIFLQKGRRIIREVVWSQDAGGYVCNDLTLMADHLGDSRFTQLDRQQIPFPLVYAPREDGQLAAMSHERELGLAAWQRRTTDGLFESVAVLTGAAEEDLVWVMVKRTINGATRRTIEAFKAIKHWTTLDQAFYVDCGKTFDNGPAKAITAISLANPIRVTSNGHGLSDGDKVRLSGILGTTELNGKVFTVDSPAANDFALRDETDSFNIDGTAFRLTLDASPAPAEFPDAATVTGATSGATGATSGATGTVVSRESATLYNCTALSGMFTDGEIIADGTNSRDCAPGFPQVLRWFTPYTSAGLITKVAKILTGLTFLAAKDVAVLADGAVQPSQTVTVGGQVTLADYANKVHVGLPYWGYLKLMPLEGGTQDGTAQGREKRIDRLTLRVDRSLGCLVGPDEDHLDPVPFRDSTFALGVPPVPFTGDVRVPYPGNFDTTGDITIVQKEPLPLSIIAVMPRTYTSG